MTSARKPLTIYKASAGSGKTFTLALEYIKLLIQDPQNYRYILAVTFTNKATEEMKTRILGQLYGIARAQSGSKDYMQELTQAFPSMHAEAIRQRAQEALDLILHHYHYFRVETIDSFFQSVVRNLARELNLTANMQIGLNDHEVEAQAVDNIVDNIQQDNDPLLTWLMDFVTEKVNDEKNWNVIGQIKEFGQNIFKDFYKENQEELKRIMDDPAFFKDYISHLKDTKTDALKTMAAFAQKYKEIAATHHLKDRHYSRGIQNAPGYFDKLALGTFNDGKTPNSYVQNAIDDPETMLRKADVNTPEGQVIINEVGPLLRAAEEKRKPLCKVLNSVDLTLQNLNELQLLGRIEREVAAINNNSNNLLLSNTQQLLKTLIDKQDSPFIYEKTGGQLRYIMIDEFQDTSTIQWENFKVLLDDCLAHNSGSLIVGDVKQSIYRWRNGDWRLLQGLTTMPDSRIGVKTLDTNHRSKRNIIRFNNIFFRIAAQLTSDEAIAQLGEMYGGTGSNPAAAIPEGLYQEALDIRRAYDDVAQKVTEGQLAMAEETAGSATIKLLPKKDYETNMVKEVQHILEHLLSAGIPAKKIAILVRKNTYIQQLANYFQQQPITINGELQMVNMVSEEAFRLDASLAVCTIVRAMHLLTHPEDRLATAALVKAYHKAMDAENQVDDSMLFVGKEDLRDMLPPRMTAQWQELLSTPLIELAEKLYNIFELNRLGEQTAYVCAFFDQLSNFMQNRVAGIEEFVEEWENTICKKPIHSDEIDGIRLLTIHKSKGLEFDHVIIPNCDWNLEKQGEILWMEPTVNPYDALPVVPITLSSKKLQGSIYNEDYQSEHLKNYVDNLNILYVAFTRAECNLFVIGKSEGARYPSLLMKKVITYLNSNADCLVADIDNGGESPLASLMPGMETEEDDDGTLTFRFGKLSPSEKNGGKENVFKPKEDGIRVDIINYDTNHDSKTYFRQSKSSEIYVMPDGEKEQTEKRNSYIQTGNVLHALFASIYTADDVQAAIDQLENEGVLYDQPMSRNELQQMIDERMATPQIAEWFAPKWKVFNECTIISLNPETGHVEGKRPDRVIYDDEQMIVVDFKTGRQDDEHKGQIRNYIALLREMGYRNVCGYLWYIRPNLVVEVK